MRVLHCPTDTGGNPGGLSRAERKVGLDSWSITFRQSYFDYEFDEVLWQNKQNYITGELKRWSLLLRAMRDFDVIHFNFGRSIMPHWISQETLRRNIKNPFLRRLYDAYAYFFELKDIPLLRKAGKGIVVTYQGSDARQVGYCRENFDITFANEPEYEHYLPENDAHRRRQIATFAKYADRIYALNPDLLRVLPQHARFMPYAHIDLNDWRISPERGYPQNPSPLIVHAPTHRHIKGTPYILDAVNRIKAEGVAFEFMLVEGLSNKEARKLYEKADLLVDQLLTGWYGGLAVEFMALGKPVICYIRQDDLVFIPEEMKKELPIINAIPATIYEVLKEWLIRRRNELAEKGRIGRVYVEKWHDPLKIAKELKSEYESITVCKSKPR